MTTTEMENNRLSGVDQIEIIDVDDFDFDGYQVVRGEFFGHVHEPCLVFNNNKLYVNKACVRKMPDIDFVQARVNAEKKLLVIKPCEESEKDSFRWKRDSDKQIPKQVTCKIFFAKVYSLMDWDFNNRIRLLGKLIRSKGEMFYLFDLKAPEIFERKNVDGKMKMSRTPAYPDDWKNHFGLSVKEHQANLQVNIYNGYAVFAIEDKKKEEESKDER